MQVDVKNVEAYNNLLLAIQDYIDKSDKKLTIKKLRFLWNFERKPRIIMG